MTKHNLVWDGLIKPDLGIFTRIMSENQFIIGSDVL